MNIKSKKFLRIIEITFIFSVFYLPGYLSQEKASNNEMFNDLWFNFIVIITSLFQIGLIIYIQYIKKDNSLKLLKINKFNLRNIPAAFLITLTIYAFLLPILILINFLPEKFLNIFANPIEWKIHNFKLLPIILISCITSAYREEIFFRSYLINNLIDLGSNKHKALLTSSLLFASGHIYQGIGGFFVTGILGYYLGLVLLKKQNLHILGIAHGLYNFTTLLLTIFT